MSGAFHGGQFWQANSGALTTGIPNADIINADVLDAWFSPAPDIVDALVASPDWLARTSPPTLCIEATNAIACARGLEPESVLLGPGSSALMFLAWRHFLSSASTVLLVEPTYGEYRHLSEQVLGARVETFLTTVGDGFRLDAHAWLEEVQRIKPDFAVLVNPNNPTGATVDVEALVDGIPSSTILWVDEAYIDYTDLPSAENLASSRPNVIVVKSLSKAYALSGLRAAYMVACPSTIRALKNWVPPWWVSLPAQVAATMVWEHLDFYAERHLETQRLRKFFVDRISSLPLRVAADGGNWVLTRLNDGCSAERVIEACAARGVFLRNAGNSAESLGDSYIRIAVKPEVEQEKILALLGQVFESRLA